MLKSLIDNKKKKKILNYQTPRQKLPKTFFGQGYIDIVKPSIIKKDMTYGNRSYGFLTNDVGEIDNKNQLKQLIVRNLEKEKFF